MILAQKDPDSKLEQLLKDRCCLLGCFMGAPSYLLQPLMKRFQIALKTYLTKQIGKLTDELRELVQYLCLVLSRHFRLFPLRVSRLFSSLSWLQIVGVKNGKKEREELGVILYGVQQQLARLQMELEKNHNQHSQIAMTRRQLEEELHDLRSTYKKACQGAGDERKKGDLLF